MSYLKKIVPTYNIEKAISIKPPNNIHKTIHKVCEYAISFGANNHHNYMPHECQPTLGLNIITFSKLYLFCDIL